MRELPQNASADPVWMYVISWPLAELGGVNQVVKNLFDRTRRAMGCEPLLLVRSWKDRKPVASVVEGRNTIHVRIRTPWFPPRRRISALAFLVTMPVLVVRMARLVRERNIRIVNVHYPDLSALVWIVLRYALRKELKLVLSFHGMDLRAATEGNSGPRLLWRLMLMSADRIIVCADELGGILREKWRIPANRFATIGNGVDIQQVQAAARSEAGRPVERPFVMSLGTYEHKKGHDVLIAAFGRIMTMHPDWLLVIAGRTGDGVVLRQLQSLRLEAPDPDRILLLQDVKHGDAMSLLGRCSVFALASRLEPFGIVVLEAGALGKPVVATRSCGITAGLAPGEIETVPANDPESLACALHSMMSDSPRAARMGRALRDRVAAEFQWDIVVRRWRTEVISSPQPWAKQS